VDSRLLRQVWSVVDEAPTLSVTHLPDRELVQHILRELDTQCPLTHEETDLVHDYLYSRVPLIRDVVLT